MIVPWASWRRAFEQASPHRVSWVNVETGEVKQFNPRRRSAEQLEALELELYDDARWVEVPYAESDDEFAAMREFALHEAPDMDRAALVEALLQPKPFRAFRTALDSHDAARLAWRENRRREAEERLRAFCEAYELTFREEDVIAARDEPLETGGKKRRKSKGPRRPRRPRRSPKPKR